MSGSSATSSQDFEPQFNAFDDRLSDDFVVQPGVSWQVSSVSVRGVYMGSGPARDVNVWFYTNGIGPTGIPNVPTGESVWTGLGLHFDTLPSEPGSFVITLPDPQPKLFPDTYWLVVQANMDFAPNGQWDWMDRTAARNFTAAWENPGGGFGFCPTWNRRAEGCGINPEDPDQVFRLSGVIQGATPVERATWGSIKAVYKD